MLTAARYVSDRLGKVRGITIQEVVTMQRTLLIRGDLGHDYRSPIDTVLNGVLQSQPEMKLETVTVLQIKETSCLLLCVFETGDHNNQTKAKKTN